MNNQSWVYHFADPLPEAAGSARELLGGKGASLKEMTLAGLAVPAGFTITTECCEAYFRNGQVWPDGLEAQVRDHLARLEVEAGRPFGRSSQPLLVSVRSGAARSMPGMMDTLLNCGLNPDLAVPPPDGVGDTPQFWHLYGQFFFMFARTVHELEADRFPMLNLEAGANRQSVMAAIDAYEQLVGKSFPVDPWQVLIECINAVFDSWHNERAIAYRQRNDIRGLHGTAVNVQMMFPSEISGIVFTQDPNHQQPDHMVIEAAYGLGEAVVSGDVTPDRYVVHRDGFEMIESEIGQKAAVVAALGEERIVDPDAECFNQDQLKTLCQLAMRVEAHFGHPVDIEFGYADGQFALLQSRGIRGMAVAQDVEPGRQEEIQRLREIASTKRHVWVTHNLAETLRSPTPLTWDVIREFMSGGGGFGRLYQMLGYRPSKRVRDEGFLELICGRIYADPHRLCELFWDGMPLSYDLDELVENPRLIDAMPNRFDGEKADERFLMSLPANLKGMWQSSRRINQQTKACKRRFEDEILPRYLTWIRDRREQSLGELDDEALLKELDLRRDRVLTDFGAESLLPGFLGGMAFDQLKAKLAQIIGPEDGPAIANSLMLALEGDTTFEQDELHYRVAKGEATLDEFLSRFGHRTLGEMELMEPRWREDPAYVKQMIEVMKKPGAKNPLEMHHENVNRREKIYRDLPNRLAEWGGSSFLSEIESDLKTAWELMPYREAGKHYLMMGYELIRDVIEALSERWDLGRSIYFLQLEELPRFVADREVMEDRIERRRTRWQAMQRLELPEVIDSASSKLDQLGLPEPLGDADSLKGTPIASGIATGIVRIINHPSEAGDLGNDYILVCPSTDPGWTPLFLNARGLIVERGGVLSHGAIVARDFGIPAVVCNHATRLLHEGSRIRIDGNLGHVSVLDTEVNDG